MTLPAPECPAPSLSALPSLRRVYGLVMRHLYLYRGSWPRLVEMMYWPMLNLGLYGFVSLSIVRQYNDAAILTGAFLGGLLLSEILVRATLAMMVMYMEEVWSRNLGHLFASPLRLRDFVAGLISLGTARTLLSVTPAFIVTYVLFDFSILQLGWYLPAYAALLCLNGWWFGLLIISLLLRFGLAAEWLGWMCSWLLMPFMAPYYPLSILPTAFQAIGRCLPGTYVFESMKAQVATGNGRPDFLWLALGLNMAYFAAACLVLRLSFHSAKKRGGLLQMGE